MAEIEVLSSNDRDDKEIDEYYDESNNTSDNNSDSSSDSENSTKDKSSDEQYHFGVPRIPLEVFQEEMRQRTMSSSSASPSSIPSPISLSIPQSFPSFHLFINTISSCALKISSTLNSEKLCKIRGKYQIPDDVQTCPAIEGEWCCTPNSSWVGFYEAYFLSGLRLPLNAFTRELLFRLGIAPNQLNPNGWRIIIAMQVLWRDMFEGNHTLTVDEFVYCYKPSEINQAIGFYQFFVRHNDCRMIRSLSSSDREWKKEFFLVSSFWAGDPIKVGRDWFPPTIGALGHLHPEGR